jgi:hypothetical protein
MSLYNPQIACATPASPIALVDKTIFAEWEVEPSLNVFAKWLVPAVVVFTLC